MLSYHTGDICKSLAEAWVCPVNCEGVAGKGLALKFKRIFPTNHAMYVEACRRGELLPGGVLVTKHERDPAWVIYLATKGHWRYPSRYAYVRDGLYKLRDAVVENGIPSVAVPALGCGCGHLDWKSVSSIMSSILGPLPCKVLSYYPFEAQHETALG